MSMVENAFMLMILNEADDPVRNARLSLRMGQCEGSGSAVGQCRLHRRAGVEGAEDLHGGDGLAGELGSDVWGDAGEAEDLDVERRAGAPRRFQILPRVVREAQAELLAGHRLLHRVALTLELVAHGRP